MAENNVQRKIHKPIPIDGNVVRKLTAPIHRTTSETIRLNNIGVVGNINDTSSSSSSSPAAASTTTTTSLEKSHLALDQLVQNASSISQTSPTNNMLINNSNINNINNNSNTIINNSNNRKKTSSFQITSVTVGSRMSNDAGDDSNDDLDESHGEDNSVELSRIEQTDIETPSYSEDTFSKEDVFFNSSNTSIGTAPVIPTSSQYGLAIVSSENNNTNNTNNDNNINTLDITSVTDNNIINLLSSNVKQDNNDISIRDSVHGHGRNERFKVVKIESTEPFKRGRWTCMDYLDHTSVNNQTNVITTNKISDPNEVCISYGVTDTGFVPIDKLTNNTNNPTTPIIVAPVPTVVGAPTSVAVSATTTPAVPSPTTTTTITTTSTTTTKPSSLSSSSQINDDINIDINGHNSIGPTSTTNTNYNVTPQQQQQHNQQTGQQLPQYYQCSHPSQQQQQQQQQAATLPTNLQSQHQNNLGQPQSMPQGTIPIINQSNNNNNNNSNVNHQNDEQYVTLTSQNQTFQGQQNVCPSSSPSTQSTNIIVTQSASQPTSTNQQQSINQLTDNIQQQQQQQSIQNIHQTTGQTTSSVNGVDPGNQVNQVSSTGQNQMTTNGLNVGGAAGGAGGSGGSGGVVSSSGAGGSNNSGSGGGGGGSNSNQTRNNFGVRFPQANYPSGILGKIGFAPSYAEQDSVGLAADAVLLECLAEVTQAAEDPKILENNENISGIGAVAIDNKIEQAMDLVKSHLMYAVREEVHILKQKITELTDHISLLEAENTILKAHASPDILAQLNSSTTKLSQNNSTNGQ